MTDIDRSPEDTTAEREAYLPHFPIPERLVVATPLVDALFAEGRIRAVFNKEQPAEVRHELLASYQVGEWLRVRLAHDEIPASLEAAARTQIRRSEAHLGFLLSGAERYIAWVARKCATRRCGEAWGRQLVGDLVSEGTVVALQCARDYDPSRSKEFRSFLSSYLDHRFAALIEAARQPTSGMPDSVASMVRLARGSVIPRLQRHLGRSPTSAELSEALIAARLEQALRTSGLDPERATAEDREAAMARLRRSGYLAAATTGLPEVLAALDGDLSLDASGKRAALSGSTLGDRIASDADTEASALGSDLLDEMLTVSLSGLHPEQAAMVRRHWEARMDADTPPTWRSSAAELGVAWTDLRDLVTAAEARLGAPHAQYCSLAFGIEAQFDLPLEGPGTALSALRRRVPEPAR